MNIKDIKGRIERSGLRYSGLRYTGLCYVGISLLPITATSLQLDAAEKQKDQHDHQNDADNP